MFFGILLLAIGLIIIVNVMFGIHLPVFRIIFGLFLIYLGFKVIFGVPWRPAEWKGQEGSVVFNTADMVLSESDTLPDSFDVVFGSSKIDLRSLKNLGDKKVEVNAIFGEVVLILPKALRLESKISSVAGQVTLPKANVEAATGESLHLEANAVFGSITVKRE